ncbi:MAG: phage virion morphogenesis protein [Blastocatellia bacterium]
MIFIDTSGLNKAIKVLPSLTKGITLRDSAQDTAKKVGSINKDQFSSLGRRGGTPWLPVADGSGRKPLHKTGALEAAATNPKVNTPNDQVIEITFTGKHSELIAVHQFGALIRRQTKQGSRTIKIPARPILALTKKDVDDITFNIFKNILKSIVKKLGVS